MRKYVQCKIHPFSAPISQIVPGYVARISCEHIHEVSDSDSDDVEDKGECHPNPSLEECSERGVVYGGIWACNGVSHEEKGNFIRYILPWQNSLEIIRLEQVDTEYCDPKPPNCHCKTLLGSLLLRHPDVNEISFKFAAKPFVAGCKCYLGEAARLGFNTVQVLTETYMSKKSCAKVRKLTSKNYPDICEKYEKNKCDSYHENWAIKKKDTGDPGCKTCKR